MKPIPFAIHDILNPARRSFLKTTAAGAALAGAGGLIELTMQDKEAQAFAYEPYYTDDQLTTVVTSCAHNCGSRHMLVAHKKGDVIVRLSTDDGRYQENGAFGKDTERSRSCAPACAAAPTARACIRPSACSTR
jgi:anaerobic dimethyl sulfoxide reductase subunit A